MEDKVVLITGSSSGIGEATAIGLAKLGSKLVIHGTDISRIKLVADRCLKVSPKGYKPVEVQCEIKDKDSGNKLIDATLNAYGKLDILINNVGLYKPVSFDQPDLYENFSDLMQINLDSVVRLTILAVPHLKASKGCIVNVSSNMSQVCLNGGFAYSTAKAGLSMFSKSIAVELAPDVRVNTVSPGPIATRMSQRCGVETELFKQVVGNDCLVERVGEADEVSRLIIFLASPESAYITGADYIIDGGSSIKPAGKVASKKNNIVND